MEIFFAIFFQGGFAFSQEENGAVKQSELIRTYDTDIDKPSGN